MDFFRRLADKSPMVSIETFGVTPQGRDLDVVILDKDGLTSPEAIKAKGRVIMLVQSCIHSGEPDGKDACMIWLRDLVITGRDKELLDDVSFLMIPVFNADGHEKFRATPFPVKYEVDRSVVSHVDYLGWQRDTVKSDLSGGLHYSVAEEAREIEVETYRFTGGTFSTMQSEGRVPLVSTTYTTQTETLVYPEGSIVLDMTQPFGRSSRRR